MDQNNPWAAIFDVNHGYSKQIEGEVQLLEVYRENYFPTKPSWIRPLLLPRSSFYELDLVIGTVSTFAFL